MQQFLSSWSTRSWNNFLRTPPHPAGLGPFFSGNWSIYTENPDSQKALVLTFLGGFHPETKTLWLIDTAHHHLAIAVIFIIAGHMYRTNIGIRHNMQEILNAHAPPSGKFGERHKNLYDTVNNSLHFQLGLASVGVNTSMVAQNMYALPPYASMAEDYATMAAVYTHHQYIAGFLMTGAFAHGAIFFSRDYYAQQNKGNVLAVF